MCNFRILTLLSLQIRNQISSESTNKESKLQIYFDGMGSLGEKDVTEVEANESYGTLAYVDEAHNVYQWTLSNFLKVFSQV